MNQITAANLKWPTELTWIRHGESAYNQRARRKQQIPDYEKFNARWKMELEAATDPLWPSTELIAMARELYPRLKVPYSDPETPLTDKGCRQAWTTGERLPELIDLPDVVYVSDYLRAIQTYKELCQGWPKLRGVEMLVDYRIHEQEHGLLTLYNDRGLYFVFNPQQALLFKEQGKFYYCYLNGENKHRVLTRVWQFYDRLIRHHAGQKVLVIAHHITILAHRANQERWSAEEFIYADDHEKPVNCGVTIYRGDPNVGRDGRGKLVLQDYNRKLY